MNGVGAPEAGARMVSDAIKSVTPVRGFSQLVAGRTWTLLVTVATVGWAAMLFLVAHDRHADFRYARFDLGNLVQAVWNTADGRLLESTEITGEQVSRLGAHVEPVLIAFAPLWIAFPSPLTLEAVQIAAVASGAFPIYWLGRRHLGSERAAALVALAYLAYPWLAWAAVDAFHPVTLAIPLLLYCAWFLDGDRLLPFALCALLLLTTGELAGIFLAGLALSYGVARRRWQVAVPVALVGVTWTYIALFVVVPHYSGQESPFYGAYESVGGSPLGIAETAVTDPGALLSAVTEPRDAVYLILLAAPLAGLFLLAPAIAALALPQVALNVMAGVPGTTDPHEHYSYAVLPFLFLALIVGLGRRSPRTAELGASVAATVAIAAAVAVGPWPGALLGADEWDAYDTSPEGVRVLERAVALIPPDAAVSATNRVGSHLAERRYYYSVPALGRATWVVVEESDAWIPNAYSGEAQPRRLSDFLSRLERSDMWLKVYDERGVLVFRKAVA